LYVVEINSTIEVGLPHSYKFH